MRNMVAPVLYTVLLCLIPLLELNAQAAIFCYPIPDCSMLDVVLVKQPTNVSSGPICPTTTACADPFRQATYKVYLRYKVADPGPGNPAPVLDFFLDYSRLNVRVQLSSQPTQHSHIATTATQACFDAKRGSTWPPPPPNSPMGGNYAILDVKDPKMVALDMNNTESGSVPCGQPNMNQIQLMSIPKAQAQAMNLPYPTGFLCSFIELYDVVINIYPGETASLNCASPSEYASFDQSIKCSPLNCINQTSAPSAPGAVATYVGTGNNPLLLSLTGSNINPSTRNCETNIELSATGPTGVLSVSYVEFMVEVSTMNKVTVEGLPGNSTYFITNDGTKQYIHFLIDLNPAVSILPLSLGKIIVDRPIAQNVAWTSTLKLINEDKSRVKTSAACTRIHLSPVDAVCSDTGDPQCQPELAALNIAGFDNSNCAETQVKIGISSNSINLTGLNLELTFAVSGTLAIDHFDFGDFAGSPQASCPTNSTGCTNGTPACYAISGNTLQVCFNCPANTFQISGIMNMNLFFTGTGCVEGVTVTQVNIGLPVFTACVPDVNLSNSAFPHCSAALAGRIATEEDNGVEEVIVMLVGNDCSLPSNNTCSNSVLTTGGVNPGRYGFCSICECSENVLTPAHDVNPLNGVSTYDLVLISKHILGLLPLTSPYKMIAADANKSRSITTFDIVIIRKLILGIYTQYPNNTSWRFVDKSYVFPNIPNPILATFPECIDINSTQQNLDFVAIKVGDLNASAQTSSRPAQRPELGLSWPASLAEAGATLTLPIIYTGDRPAEAIQLGLRFDPARLAFIGPSKGSLPGYAAANFNLNDAAKGEIRTLWIPDYAEPDRQVQPGDVLFYLSFKVLAPATGAGPLLQLDDTLLENLAWTPEGIECAVRGAAVQERDLPAAASSSAGSSLQVTCAPHPTQGIASLRIQSAAAGKARVWLFKANGGRVLLRDLMLSADSLQEIALPELAQLPSGVYLWKVALAGEQAEGRLVKE